MSHCESILQSGTPRETARRQVSQVGHLSHSKDREDDRECFTALVEQESAKCCSDGTSVEPLAFHLPPLPTLVSQNQSPLYGLLPNEIRLMIWEYALTDTVKGWLPNESEDTNSDIAYTLLRVCKAIYLETYRLPMQLNGFLSHYKLRSHDLNLKQVLPWQYALIHRLDLKRNQFAIEGKGLKHTISKWKPEVRHSGALVAPRLFDAFRPEHHPKGMVQAHNFGLLPSSDSTSCLKDGDNIVLQRGRCLIEHTHSHGLQDDSTFTARGMLARPITHLTLRISRADWYSWDDDPRTTDKCKQLALDPACSRSNGLNADIMRRMAASRRAGHHPILSSTWGAVVTTLQDLKLFELVLETFPVKQSQLDEVVECAKTWKFPLQDTQYELTHHGHVESMLWTRAQEEPGIGEAALTEDDHFIHSGCFSDFFDQPNYDSDDDPFDFLKLTSRLPGSEAWMNDSGCQPWMRDAGVEVRVIRFRRRRAG